MKLVKCLVPAAALFLAACTPGPEDAVSDFFEAGKQGDIDTIISLVHNAEMMKQMLDRQGEGAKQKASEEMKEMFSQGEQTILGSECATESELAEMDIAGLVGACEVEVEFTPFDKNEEVEKDTIEVIDQGNGWKVVF